MWESFFGYTVDLNERKQIYFSPKLSNKVTLMKPDDTESVFLIKLSKKN